MAKDMPIPESVIFFALPSVPFATGFVKDAQFLGDYSDEALDAIVREGYFGIAPELAYGAQIPFGVIYCVERAARDPDGKRIFECRAIHAVEFDLTASGMRNGFWRVRWRPFRARPLARDEARTLEFRMLCGILAFMFRAFLKKFRAHGSYGEIVRCETTRYVLKNLKMSARPEPLEQLLNCMMDVVSMFAAPSTGAGPAAIPAATWEFLIRAGFRFSSTRSLFRRITITLYVLCVFCYEPNVIRA